MPKPYVIGWYEAFKALNSWRKHDGWRIMWRRRRIWLGLVKKRYYWVTTEERVESMQRFIDAMGELREQWGVSASEEEEEEDTEW